jgi:penicillin-binding protein 1C
VTKVGSTASEAARPAARFARTGRWCKCAIAGTIILLAAGYAVLEIALHRMGPVAIDASDADSVMALDRNGRLLRAFTTNDGRWRLPVEAKDVDQRYLAMLLAFEDRRFHSHPGVDVAAVTRAGGQLMRYGRIVSGASTLTMQVARLIEGSHERTASGKARQMLRAIQLERQLTKDQILALYLKLAPFGGNIEGVRAASLTYFGKEPRRLSAAESALLVALPQAPESRRPDRHAARARLARNRVLDRMVDMGVISAEEAEAAKAEPIPAVRKEFPKLAPHLAESEAEVRPEVRIHRLTLERDLQQSLEALARDHAQSLGSKLSAAILVIDNRTGEIIAYVGSADYFDASRNGAIDMAKAIRSPGSTLKPLIYGLAFERGIAHPETLIEDRPVRFGTYAPKNFDTEFHGTVTIREALQKSLNVPAVKVLSEAGPQALFGRLQDIGVNPVLPDTAEPSIAIALGGLGLRLTDLGRLYVSLARNGEAVEPIFRIEERKTKSVLKSAPTRRLLRDTAAWQVAHILAGSVPPENAKPGMLAYKTGTSYGFRDAWAIGFDARTTIAVWVGRPDGASTLTLTGRNAAAPILFEAFQRLGRPIEPIGPAPDGTLLVRSPSELPPPMRRFQLEADRDTASTTEPRVQFAFPLDRTEVELEEEDGSITLKADGGKLPLVWLVDGSPVEAPPHARELTFSPKGRGFVRLSVVDADGRADHIVVRLR